ncbi:MAG: cupin domain-containing protein [Actinomycetota bacterium]|nr:cupin domain-containing protein [Actinomycetota bacterium]
MPTPSTRTRVPRTRAAREDLADGALARCIAPVRANQFRAEHWERRPLVVGRSGGAGFDDLLSEADVERLLTSGIRHPAFRLVRAGETVRLADYTVDIPWRPSAFTGLADVERIAVEFARGATVVVQGLHHWWRPLAVFSRALERELGHPVQTNAYWTPRDSQGLPIHHDTHDVFVLQVAGEKRWLVYEPAWELPLKEQRYTAEMGDPGPCVLDLTLRPGDTLYLPRGWLHQAVTSATDSLHLTVGVNPYTWIDAVRAALSACEADVRFRRSVSEDGIGGEELLDALAARLDPAAVARRMRRRFVATRRPILDDQLTQVRALRDLDLATAVERRTTVIADLAVEDDQVTLAFEGKTIAFPAHARVDLEHAARAEGRFRASELPGDLDDAGRLVLVRRLVREGFLRISDPGRGAPLPRSGGDAQA